MARQTINNAESGLDVRNKLNDNFTELYTDFSVNTPMDWGVDTVVDGTARRNSVSTSPLDHPGQGWAATNIQVSVPGSLRNGPTSADVGQVISVAKEGRGTGTANIGEIDGLYIFVRQDGPDGFPQQDPSGSDSAGVLCDVENRGSCGFVAQWEGVSVNKNRATGLTDFRVRNYFGVLDMSPPTPTKVGYGVVAETGVIDAAFLIQETGTGQFTTLFQSSALEIGRNGDYTTSNSFWTNGAWAIQRTAPENGSTQFTHRGTGALFFNTPDGGAVLFNASRIGMGTLSPSPAAALDITSTTGGLLLPRMTTAQRDAIPTPPNGLQIYNTTTRKFQGREDGVWVQNDVLPDGSAATPAMRFANSTGTGFFRPAADVFAVATAGVERLRVGATGNISVGFTTAATGRVEIRSTGEGAIAARFTSLAASIDLRPDDTNGNVIRWGGPTPAGGGTLRFLGVSDTERLRIESSGNLRPGADNTQNFGTGAFRWATVFAGTGTINTSDEREKEWRGPLNEAELRAAKRIAAEIGIFQFLDAIAEKGPDARLHCGVRAQRTFAILEDEGLEWQRYAWCCYDEWEAASEVPEERDEEGNVVRPMKPAKPAGNRYGIRTDQLALWLIAAQEQRLLALEVA